MGHLGFTADAGSIKNLFTGMCVDLPGTGKGINYGVHQWYCVHSDTDNEEFSFQRTRTVGTAAYYRVRNKDSLQCLDLPNTGWVAAGTRVNMWDCTQVVATDNQEGVRDHAFGDDRFLHRNVADWGLCLDVPGVWQQGRRDGARPQARPCDVNDDHLWTRYVVAAQNS
ncbi:RICIN domain-containing protein [Streptomyces sp. NPDC058486]|uniref:RICIN domain-containing protein n=1 Tax=unclassified Streptomyces TaxID=2593676 RepID=UPI003656FBCD